MPLKIYSAARSVMDCFKFRNKLGMDVALEALRLARQRKRVQNRELLHYARLLRVENPMSPYLQAIELLAASRTPLKIGGLKSARRASASIAMDCVFQAGVSFFSRVRKLRPSISTVSE